MDLRAPGTVTERKVQGGGNTHEDDSWCVRRARGCIARSVVFRMLQYRQCNGPGDASEPLGRTRRRAEHRAVACGSGRVELQPVLVRYITCSEDDGARHPGSRLPVPPHRSRERRAHLLRRGRRQRPGGRRAVLRDRAAPVAPRPAAPATLNATGGDGLVRLDWAPVARATHYNLHWSKTAGLMPGAPGVERIRDHPGHQLHAQRPHQRRDVPLRRHGAELRWRRHAVAGGERDSTAAGTVRSRHPHGDLG